MQTARRVLVALTMVAVVLCSWLAPLDAPAMQQVDAGLKRALLSFATARVAAASVGSVWGGETCF